MLRVFIGTEENQLIPCMVLEYSIKKTATAPVDVKAVYMNTEERKGGTNFGFVRFSVPKLSDYKGVSVYVDADQLVLGDITKLPAYLDGSKYDLALVKQPEGFFGKKEVPKHNQTSVMVLNCEKLTHWKTPDMYSNVVGNRDEVKEGQIMYRNFMKLDWYDQSKIQELPPEWNHYNVIKENTKLVHFSHVRSQPWRNAKHKLCDAWGQWLREAVKAGYIPRWTLVKEIFKGHIHPNYLKCVF